MLYHVKDVTECCICVSMFCNDCMLGIAHPCVCVCVNTPNAVPNTIQSNVIPLELKQHVCDVIENFYFHDIMCAEFAFLGCILSKGARFVKHSNHIVCLIDNVKNSTSGAIVYGFPGDSYSVAYKTFDPSEETCDQDIIKYLEET